ncbi:MAG: Na/Pi cotransporter family protein [Pseudomonadota bacterium]
MDLAGYVALLLWGVRMVQTGVQRALGQRLHTVLGAALADRWRAFLGGLGVTALLQSSTATALMVGGFAAQGLVGLTPALAVMLGANVGTALIVQALSFDTTAVAPLFVLAGFASFQWAGAPWRDLGRVLIGLGLVLFALHQFVDVMRLAAAAPLMREAISQLASHIVFFTVIGTALAWAAHSSIAVVLLTMSFAAQGVLPIETGFALVLGANLGAAINPVLESAKGRDRTAQRLLVGNLINRGFGVWAALTAFPFLASAFAHIEPAPARVLADFHMAFNVALAVLFFPWLNAYAKLLERLLPTRADTADLAAPLYLDKSALDTPILALGAAAREALRMADVLETMLRGARAAFEKADRQEIGQIRRTDDVLDKLNRAIKTYIVSIDLTALGGQDRRRLNAVLSFAMHVEQAGDAIDKGLMALLAKGVKRELSFSSDSQTNIAMAIDRLIENLRAAASVFVSGDEAAARMLVQQKEAFRGIETEATEAHFAQVRAGRQDAIETSALYLDVLRDLKRINAHLVEAAAYPILKAAGDLLPNRLRSSG